VSKSQIVRMSRSRLYALIDSFEADMRAAIEQYLLGHQDESTLLGPDYEEARSRRDSDQHGNDVSIVHYLDLRPCFDLMLRNRNELSHELAEEISTNAALLDHLVPIRRRVMHGRPLNQDDPESAISCLTAFRSRHWKSTQATLLQLRQDPAWEPYLAKLEIPNERVLHNLPEADYDETGFVGRRDEAQKLLSALERGRDNVITITGEGGIGKTALALDVAYRLLDSETNPFEAILWVSLKTEKLTAYGVEELNDAIQGIDETVAAIGLGLIDDFTGRVKELAESLDGITCLIIIDNLESAQGSEVIELYESLPDSVRYLFTSRLGIGQLERRYPLPSLQIPEAKLLFRKFAAKHDQRHLAGLSEKTLEEVLLQLRYSPLAIRWYVLSAESGKVPLDILRSQQELLDFCVKNVYDGLSEGSRAVLSVLRSMDRSISFDEFAVLTDMTIDELRFATQELTRGSLVVVEAESAGVLSAKLALTATARAFLPRPDRTGVFITKVLQRERQFKATIQQRAAESESGINVLLVRPRDASDHPAMHLLNTALSFARTKKYAKAHEQVERARNFNPEFSEVHRVAGYVDALEGRYESAVSEYQSALHYGSEERTIAVTSHSLAAVLARKLHDPNLGLPHAQRAYDLWRNGDTAFLLGTLKAWTGEYAMGQELIEEALDSASGKHLVVVSTALTDSWARWAEEDYRGHRYAEALNKAAAGFHSGQELMNSAHRDVKLVEAIVECCIVFLRSLTALSIGQESHDKKLSEIARFLNDAASSLRWSKKVHYAKSAANAQLERGNSSLAAANDLRKAIESLESATA
jgi:LuxR family glucitol operon transcriptional activator